MTKGELIELIRDYPENGEVIIFGPSGQPWVIDVQKFKTRSIAEDKKENIRFNIQ